MGQIGNVISIKCVTDKRYGFVKFASVEEATTAIEEIDGLECYDTTLRVKYADMAPGKGKEKGFGAPSHVPPPQPQVVLPPASVHSPTAHVVAPPPPAVSRVPVAPPHAHWAAPRVRIFAQDLPSELSSDAIRSMFENYCSSVECEILTRTATDSVAMVSVPTFDEAQWIVENLNGNIPHGINKPIRVCVAWPSEYPPRKVPPASFGKVPARVPAPHGYSPYHGGKGGAEASYGASYGGKGGKSAGPDPPIDNVYVFQLPPDFNEARLSDLFADCGSIISVKCVPEKKYGFVRFASVEEAQHAIDMVNGALVDGQPIGVQFARSKNM